MKTFRMLFKICTVFSYHWHSGGVPISDKLSLDLGFELRPPAGLQASGQLADLFHIHLIYFSKVFPEWVEHWFIGAPSILWVQLSAPGEGTVVLVFKVCDVTCPHVQVLIRGTFETLQPRHAEVFALEYGLSFVCWSHYLCSNIFTLVLDIEYMLLILSDRFGLRWCARSTTILSAPYALPKPYTKWSFVWMVINHDWIEELVFKITLTWWWKIDKNRNSAYFSIYLPCQCSLFWTIRVDHRCSNQKWTFLAAVWPWSVWS